MPPDMYMSVSMYMSGGMYMSLCIYMAVGSMTQWLVRMIWPA